MNPDAGTGLTALPSTTTIESSIGLQRATQTMNNKLTAILEKQTAVKLKLRQALKELKDFDHTRLVVGTTQEIKDAQLELLNLQTYVSTLADDMKDLASTASTILRESGNLCDLTITNILNKEQNAE